MDGASNGLVVRVARPDELAPLSALVERSFRTLAVGHYTPAEIDAASGTVIRVDAGLLADATYFVAELDGVVAGCGGWSMRHPTIHDAILPEQRAEVRAMFVAPEHAGRGVGGAIIAAAEREIVRAGFESAYLIAIRSGRGFFEHAGYRVIGEHQIDLGRGLFMGVTPMMRSLSL